MIQIRCSLKNFLITFTIAGLVMGLYGIRLRDSYRDEAILNQLSNYGPHADYRFGRLAHLTFSNGKDKLSDSEMMLVKKLSGLQSLTIVETDVTLRGLHHLTEMDQLTYLLIDANRFSEEDVSFLWEDRENELMIRFCVFKSKRFYKSIKAVKGGGL